MTTKFSTIFYTNLNDKGESFILPTIQSISIPDNTTIPSKPTITGEYRNQYVATSAVRVSFTVWLEAGHYGDETLDVSETLDHLVYLKKHRLLFNLITSHTEEESRFFTNLAIENISYSREAEHRNRLVCVINCVQRWLVNVTWSLASAVEIFGHEIFTDPNASTETINMDFVPGTTSEDFELSNSSVKDLFKKIGDISGFTDMPVTRHIRNEIENQVTLDKYSYYFKLGEPIDMSVGSRIYNCSCQFKSRYGLGTEDESYTVDLSKFTITVTKKDTSIEQNYPVAAILGASLGFDSSGLSEAGSRLAAKNNVLPTDRYMYDTTDTYKNANPPYTVSTSFEYIEKKDGLAKYLKTAKENGRFTTDKSAVSTGSVVVINDYVWSYKISNHYTFDVGYGSFKKTLTPDGGLKVDVFKLTQTDGFKITVSNEKRQADWDGIANSLSLVVVTLGTQIQLYLFSPVLFSMTKVAPAT
jgi:hypothetical protein